MISASRCKLPSNGAGAWARAGVAAATTLTRAAMKKRRAIGFRLRGNRTVAEELQGEISYHKLTERWPRGRFGVVQFTAANRSKAAATMPARPGVVSNEAI